MKKKPLVSVILPVYNEEKRIGRCLDSVLKQDYPKSRVEILVVDDNSTDNTVRVAKKRGVIVYKNGSNNIEKGKSIGLAKAKGEYIFFIDADNVLLSNDWFTEAIKMFQRHKGLVGVQSYRFRYFKDDPLVNRYCSLFGINDPLVYYLGKRGQLAQTESTWIYPNTLIKDHKKYFHCKFTPENLPTIGSQGYMTKRSFLKKTSWKPYLFHLDSVYQLVEKGYNEFAFIKEDIQHDYALGVRDMLKKLRRNIRLYNNQKELRQYKYDISFTRLIKATLIMVLVVVPLYEAVRGFLKKPDIAWFLHPVLSFCVVWLYSFEMAKSYFTVSFSRR